MMQSYRLSVSTSVKGAAHGPASNSQSLLSAQATDSQSTCVPWLNLPPPFLHSSQFPLNVCARPQGQHNIYSIALLPFTLLLEQLNTIWPSLLMCWLSYFI